MMSTIALALIWQPYFPPVWTLGVAAVLLSLAVWAHARSSQRQSVPAVLSVVMRLTLIGLITLLLMGPSTLREGRDTTTKPELRILLDSSASMQTADVDDLSRYDYAWQTWLTPDRLAALRGDYDVQLYTFDASLRTIHESHRDRPSASAATAGVSHIADAVAQAITHRPGAGSAMLVISDGRDTLDAPMHPVGRLALAAGTPVYTVPLGGPSMARDVAVTAVPAQPYLFAEEPGAITVRVIRSNIHQLGTVLNVQHGDQHDTYPLNFRLGDTASVDVPIRHDEPGRYDYKVWTDAIPGEADPTNNTQPVFIEVTAKQLRVLVLEGQPYWDTKFLAHALRKDPRIELTQITQLTRDRRETIAPGNTEAPSVNRSTDPPDSLEALAAYDVIILGKKIGNLLDERTIALLPEYVAEYGGRLVFARGRAYDPETDTRIETALRDIEPVVYGEGTLHHQRIELEPAGLRHPGLQPTDDAGARDVFAAGGSSDLPTLLNVPVIEREKAATRVLARTRPSSGPIQTDAGQPAIVTMPYGRGMAVAVLGEGLWRWALRPRTQAQPDARFDRFWMDNIRWLALGSDYQPGESVSLRLSRLGVQVGDPIQIDLVGRSGLNTGQLQAEVEAPDGRITNVSLDPVAGSTTRYRAEYYPESPGIHHVRARSAENPDQTVASRFNSYHIDIERMHTSANPSALRTLSEASEGRCLDPDDPDAFDKLLARQRQAAKTPPTPHYLWDRGWVLTLVLCWAGMEWIVRRVGGLP